MWNGVWKPAYATMIDMFDWDEYAGQVDEQLVQVIREGAELSALDAGLAAEARGRMWDRFAAFMGEYDLLVSPTLAIGSFPVDDFCPPALAGESLMRQLLGWLLTYPTNMLGTPAISVPAGFDSEGMPVGLQIAGGLHAEAAVIRAAAAFEAARPWADRRPPAAAGAVRGDADLRAEWLRSGRPVARALLVEVEGSAPIAAGRRDADRRRRGGRGLDHRRLRRGRGRPGGAAGPGGRARRSASPTASPTSSPGPSASPAAAPSTSSSPRWASGAREAELAALRRSPPGARRRPRRCSTASAPGPS